MISLIDGFGFMWVAGFVGLVMLARRRRTRAESLLLWGTILAVPWTTFFTTFFTLVRETRILFPPFIFVIPLAMVGLKPIWEAIRPIGSRRFWVAAVITLVVAAAFRETSLWFWPELDYGSSGNFRRYYAGTSIGLAVAYLIGLGYSKFFPRQSTP